MNVATRTLRTSPWHSSRGPVSLHVKSGEKRVDLCRAGMVLPPNSSRLVGDACGSLLQVELRSNGSRFAMWTAASAGTHWFPSSPVPKGQFITGAELRMDGGTNSTRKGRTGYSACNNSPGRRAAVIVVQMYELSEWTRLADSCVLAKLSNRSPKRDSCPGISSASIGG